MLHADAVNRTTSNAVQTINERINEKDAEASKIAHSIRKNDKVRKQAIALSNYRAAARYAEDMEALHSKLKAIITERDALRAQLVQAYYHTGK